MTEIEPYISPEMQEVGRIDELLRDAYTEAARLNILIESLQQRRIQLLRSTIRVAD